MPVQCFSFYFFLKRYLEQSTAKMNTWSGLFSDLTNRQLRLGSNSDFQRREDFCGGCKNAAKRTAKIHGPRLLKLVFLRQTKRTTIYSQELKPLQHVQTASQMVLDESEPDRLVATTLRCRNAGSVWLT